MIRPHFDAIIADIEKHMEGDGYAIFLRTNNGHVFTGSWQWLMLAGTQYDILILNRIDMPPLYIPLSSIEIIGVG